MEDVVGAAAVTDEQFPRRGKMTADQVDSPVREDRSERMAERLAGGPVDEQIAAAPEEVLGQAEADANDLRVLSRGGQIPAPSHERFAQVEQEAIARSLDLAIAWRLVQAQAGRLKLDTTLAIFPFLEAGGTAERNTMGEWGCGPALISPVPVWDWGQGQIPQELSRLRQRIELYAAAANDLRSAARAVEARFQASRSRAMYMRDVVMPLHAALASEAQLQYNAMQLTPFQLLEIKTQQIAAGQAYVIALQEYWLARTDLEQLLAGTMPPGVLVHAAAGPLGTSMPSPGAAAAGMGN